VALKAASAGMFNVVIGAPEPEAVPAPLPVFMLE